MTAQDIGGVAAWTAMVGLAVDQGWTAALVGMFISGFVVLMLNTRTSNQERES